jgi:3-oxoacyl-[acyl-carrier-protein] synthase III
MPRSSVIVAVEYVLGSVTRSYEELEESFGAEAMKKVYAGSGIRNRQIAAPGVCGSDLAFDAATKLLERSAVDRASIDLLIHCTQTPDHFMPSTACLLQHRLGLGKNCAAFDITLGCSQYVYGLSIAHSMIVAGVAHRALVLTGDTMSRTVNAKDRSLVPLMGDAGSATLIDGADGEEGFLAFELGTDGSGSIYNMIPAGGFRQPISAETAVETTDAEGNVRSPENMFMNGAAVFHFAISVVPKAVTSLLAKVNLTIDQIDCVLFHQANRYMLDYLVKKLKISPEKTHYFIENTGNTSGSTMPAVLSDAISHGKVKPGSLVLMIVFGNGLSWAGTVMRWPEPAAI